jgi:D-alanyl-D-alanine carboxypeptidase
MQDRLQTILDGFVAKGIVGASAAIARASGSLVAAAAGLADRDRRIKATPSHLFKIGSVTKSFVAATMMRLAEDGVVDVKAPIARWFPSLPYADRITVRQLIDHRSGMPEFELRMPMAGERVWQPQEIVDLAYTVAPPSEPGQRASYTNTAFVVAGMLIEHLTGDTLAGQIRKRVSEPLGLADTYAAAGEAYPVERLVRGYYYRPPLRPEDANLPFEKGGEMWRTEGILGYSEELQDSSALFPFSGAYAAGDMVATASDLARFAAALFAGQLVRRETLAAMLGDLLPVSFLGTRMREGGAGLFALDYAGRRVFGHQGSMPGYVTVMAHDPASGASAALTTNSGSGNRLHFYARGLHEAFDEVIALAAE